MNEEQDYLAAVLKGECKTMKVVDGQLVRGTISFKQWLATKDMRLRMRMKLADRLLKWER